MKNRLVLSGDPTTLAAVQEQVIRPQRGASVGRPESFDFEALIPMPESIAAMLTGSGEDGPDRAQALATTRAWCQSNWGVQGNAADFVVHGASVTHLDLSFTTPSFVPLEVFAELARQWPNLRGCVWSVDEMQAWGFAEVFVDGRGRGGLLDFSRNLERLVQGWSYPFVDDGLLLARWLDCLEQDFFDDADAETQVRLAAGHVDAKVPDEVRVVLDFEADIRDLALWTLDNEEAIGDGLIENALDEGFVRDPRHIAFLRERSRLATRLDVRLLAMVASSLRATNTGATQPLGRLEAWLQTRVSDEEFQTWASAASQRSDFRIDASCRASIAEAAHRYSVQRSEEAVCHLEVCAAALSQARART